MSRELFPFFLLGEGHGDDTTGNTTTPVEKPTPAELTVGTVSRDFRPKNPDAHQYSPIPGNKLKVAGTDDPKALSAQGDAKPSGNESPDSPTPDEGENVSVEKGPNDDPEDLSLIGNPEQPAQESFPSDPATLTSSSLLL